MEKDGYWSSTKTAGLLVLGVYVGTLQLLRFRRLRRMQKMDVQADPSAVYRQLSMLEFPFTVTKALEFALFRTYGVPSISALLVKTQEFTKHVGKRYDDTDLILREYAENLTSTDRSRTALARLNAIHGAYAKEISNADMLYTLSLFITEPATWIDRFEWRKSTAVDRAALLGHFSNMGKGMGIKGVSDWKTFEDAKRFQEAYEEKHFCYNRTNKIIAESTIELFLSIAPKPFRAGGRWAVYALMDPPLLDAMGLPQAPILLQWMMKGSLYLRALLIRLFLPPRPEFLINRRTPFDDDTGAGVPKKPRFDPFSDSKLGCLFYQKGYRIEDLGSTKTCPAGRLVHDLPSYTGHGGGGSDAMGNSGTIGSAESNEMKKNM